MLYFKGNPQEKLPMRTIRENLSKNLLENKKATRHRAGLIYQFCETASRVYMEYNNKFGTNPKHDPVLSSLISNKNVIGIEVPVWKIGAINYTGHIDLLAVIGNTLIIADYKPKEAEVLRSIPQILAYAYMIKERLGLMGFKNVLCVGFTKDVAWSFNPSILETEVLHFINYANLTRKSPLYSKKNKGKAITELLNDLTALIIGLPLPLSLNYAYSKNKTIRNLTSEDRKSELLYKFDASIGNIEYDLEKIHREIREKNQKLIYIIDELDKLKPKQVAEVLKFFKNLFTLSDALFIFIGGEEIFALEGVLSQNQSNIYRAKEYTYFTSKYFLSRPNWSDLNDYFDYIVLDTSGSGYDTLSILKNALFFEAKNDFFDLKRFIKSRIVDFDEDDNPIVFFEEKDEDVQKNRFYRSVLIIFEEKYISRRFNEWKNNEILLRQIFEHAHNVFNLIPNQPVVDPSDESVISEIIRDFNSLLYRLEAFTITKEEQKMIRGFQTPIRTYKYVGKIPKDPPEKLDELTEFEQRYLQVFENFRDFLLPVYNAKRRIKGEKLIESDIYKSTPYSYSQELREWQYHPSTISEENFAIYSTLKNEIPPFKFRRENIESKTKQILGQNDALFNNFNNTLSQGILKIYPGYNLKILQLQSDRKLFTGDLGELKRAFVNFNPLIISTNDYTRQILITHNNIEEIEEFKEIIEKNSEQYKFISIIKENKRKIKIRGVSIISFESAESLNNSLIELFNILPNFFETSEKK